MPLCSSDPMDDMLVERGAGGSITATATTSPQPWPPRCHQKPYLSVREGGSCSVSEEAEHLISPHYDWVQLVFPRGQSFLPAQNRSEKQLRTASMYHFLVELTAAGKLFDGFQPLLICKPLNKTCSLVSIMRSCQSEVSDMQWWEESLQDAWNLEKRFISPS